MKRFLLSLILLVRSVFAQENLPLSEKLISEFDPRRDVISDEYLAGPYLIYDCEAQHWVCVMEEYFKECQEKRREDQRLKKTLARCAPMAQFPVKFSCFQEQLRLVSNVDASKLCVLAKEKEISFE